MGAQTPPLEGQENPDSVRQEEEQPSPLTVFPSSQSSGGFITIESPQTEEHTEGWPVQE